MMDHGETDRLLSELFKKNAPYVDEAAVQERVGAELPLRRRRSREARALRIAAVGFASVALAVGLAFGIYQAVAYFSSSPVLVITDSTLPSGDTGTSGPEEAGTSALAGLVPVMGTATLEEVRSEGATAQDGETTSVRGQVLVYRLELSQPAASGLLEITSDLGMRPDGGGDIAGSWLLSNDRGTWSCSSWKGTMTADGEQFAFGTAVGADAYEGLTAFLQWHSTETTGSGLNSAIPESGLITGWIQSAD